MALKNDLYANEWSLYRNHFIPNMKLLEKEKINSKYRKKYEAPNTPYQRLLESPDIEQSIKETQQQIHATLNPFELKKRIEEKLKIISRYVSTNRKPRFKTKRGLRSHPGYLST